MYELHGSVHRNYCMKCRQFYGLDFMMETAGVPRCPVCGGVVKPDVVLYEEALDQETMEAAVLAIARADMLIIGGTSLAVYPAAGLIRYYRGNKLTLINKSPTPLRPGGRPGAQPAHRPGAGVHPGIKQYYFIDIQYLP